MSTRRDETRSRAPEAQGRHRLTKILPVLAVPALALAACSSGGSNSASTKGSSTTKNVSLASLETPPSATVNVTETGSSLLYPLFTKWAPAYTQQHSNITVSPASTGSGTGIAQAAAGAVDIGASDAYLAQSQTTATPSLENIPLAISSQMINYNIPGFTGTLKLNGTVLAKMYEGKITTWNDPAITAINPGVTIPAVPIVPLHRSDGSGDTFLFTSYLSKAAPQDWTIPIGTTVAFPAVPGALAENGNGGMVTGCQSTPGCVAYIGVSYLAKTQQAGLGEAELRNGSGNYEPLTAQTVQAEAASFADSTPASGTISLIDGPAKGGYPIINYEYAIVSSSQSDPTKAQAIKALLAWAIDPHGGSAPSFLSQVDFQPLPSSAVTVAANLLAKIS